MAKSNGMLLVEHSNAIQWVEVSKIWVGDRFRKIDEQKAHELAGSIGESGAMLQPIGLSRDSWLVWGAHRLRAAEILGWEKVPCLIRSYNCDDPRAKLEEIDENLRRSELSALEISQALVARKAAYERLHPETRKGAKGGRKTKASAKPDEPELNDKMSFNSADRPKSFSADTAEQTGKSKRTIERAVEVGKKLDKDAAKLIKGTAVADSPTELAKLAKQEPAMQRTVAAMLKEGQVATVTEALREPEPEREPVEEASQVLRGMCEKMASAWRASCGAAATAQLGAAVLESVAEEWLTQRWEKPTRSKSRR